MASPTRGGSDAGGGGDPQAQQAQGEEEEEEEELVFTSFREVKLGAAHSRRQLHYLLVDQSGHEHLAAIGEDMSGDAHYTYASTPGFADAYGPVDCHNKRELHVWCAAACCRVPPAPSCAPGHRARPRPTFWRWVECVTLTRPRPHPPTRSPAAIGTRAGWRA